MSQGFARNARFGHARLALRAPLCCALPMAEADAQLEDNGVFREPAPFSYRGGGLELHFHPQGEERLARLLSLIAGARSSLRLAYYIFAMDRAGAAVRDGLAEAAQRGVKVTLILDGFGAAADDEFLSPLTDAGGQVLRFSARWNVRYLIRNHQKMTIADGETAMIGGFNIEDCYFAGPEDDGWSDLGIELSGPMVARLTEWFDLVQGWTANPQANLIAARQMVRNWSPGTGHARWLVGGPSRWLNSWARCVIGDIKRATRLDMMMAYFSPRSGLVRKLGDVARRGATKGGGVRLVLAGKTDNGATIGAARANYGRLLRRGVQIHEFMGSKLHTKLIVVDDAVYLGSANFDMRSLYLNLELMLKIEDAALAQRMREFISLHLPASVHVTRELHRSRRSWWTRILWTLSWFLVTVVDYTVTRRLNLGLDPEGDELER